MSTPYISCLKIAGVPLLPPLITPQIREQCLEYKRKAVELDRKKERDRLFKQCIEDLELIEYQTKDLAAQCTLESQLAFGSPPKSPSHVPYETYKKLKNLTLETIDVTQYSDDGVRVMNKSDDSCRLTPPKLIRSNSYTLDNPSPILLAHLEKEAKKCIEVEPPRSPSPVSPQFKAVLDTLPEPHCHNVIEILKQQDQNRIISDHLISEDKPVSISISSQSLYYSFLSSPETTAPTFEHDLNVVNLRHSKNKAASIIGAAVKGYLVRRLIRTEKVQSLIETIKDALLCAIELHGAEVIEESDVELHRRLIQQVSAACYAFHDIFFSLSVKDQMGIIATDRERKKERAKRPNSGINDRSLNNKNKVNSGFKTKKQ